MLAIRTVPLGVFQTNCVILSCPQDGDCWVVDPGMSPEPAIEYVRDDGLEPNRIMLTHGHCDHLSALAAVHSSMPAPVAMHARDGAWAFTDTNTLPPFFCAAPRQ
ncbi:MAG: MBL fold metallo-hydrolase, partial [Phycisphaerae bacterium]|nr:MBL fold metallo-hydrolase [Phycisphaerae bacterium]